MEIAKIHAFTVFNVYIDYEGRCLLSKTLTFEVRNNYGLLEHQWVYDAFVDYSVHERFI